LNPFGELKKRLYAAVSIAFIIPLAIGAFVYVLVKTTPLMLLGFAVIGGVWVLRRLWQRWQD
jgi:hypothetical protein